MSINSLVLVSPLPKPGLYYGQSVSFQMLIEGIDDLNIPYTVIDLSSPHIAPNGIPSLKRASEYLRILGKYFSKTAFGNKTVYIGIARSRYGFFRDFIMIWFAFFNGHKIVCHVKGGNYHHFYAAQPSWLKYIIRQTLLKVDNILVLGENLRSMYDFEPRLKRKIHVLLNGLPFKGYQKPQPKNLPETPEQPIRILYLSNLIESKGYLDVLEAVKILVEKNDFLVECNFCGKFLTNPSDDTKVTSAEQGKQLFESFVAENKLSKNIMYQGVVFGEKKLNLLQNSHFFVLPTNYHTEGQPVSIIEAMAYGNVVISTDYRAIPDMVINNETGYLVNYGKPNEIAEIICRLRTNPDMYHQISEGAISHFQENFTREAHLEKIIPFLIDK